MSLDPEYEKALSDFAAREPIEDDEAQDRANERAERRKYISCRDRMCGASDCPNCFPASYDQVEKEECEQEEDEE